MAKFLWQVSYTQAGMKGVMKEGGTSRQTAIEKLAQNMGGSIDAFYFAFGEDDVILIGDFPSNVDVAAVAMNVAATGAASIKTTVLLTPEEVDEATRKTVEYRAPGE